MQCSAARGSCKSVELVRARGDAEERPSANRKYLSLTCTVYAHSKAELDALYRELTSCSQVLVAL